jgi:hypothetical protein
MNYVGCVGLATEGWRFEHVTLIVIKVLVTNYFSPAFLGSVNCFAMLVPNPDCHQLSSCTDPRSLKEFSFYCRLWDLRVPILGRILGS